MDGILLINLHIHLLHVQYFYLLIKAISKEDAIKQVEEKEIPTGEYELTGKTIADMQQIQ